MPTLTTQDYAAICKKSYNEDDDMHQGVPVKFQKVVTNFIKFIWKNLMLEQIFKAIC